MLPRMEDEKEKERERERGERGRGRERGREVILGLCVRALHVETTVSGKK